MRTIAVGVIAVLVMSGVSLWWVLGADDADRNALPPPSAKNLHKPNSASSSVNLPGLPAKYWEMVGTADWGCSATPELSAPGPCPSGVESFMVFGRGSSGECHAGFETNRLAAAVFLSDRLEGHAAWSLWASTRAPFIRGTVGTVLAYRAATGNSGVLLYLDETQQIVGIDEVCVQGGIDRQLAERVPSPDYLVEPPSSPITN